MSLKVKLTVIITAMIMVVIAALTVSNVTRAANLQKTTTYLYADEMASSNAVEIQRRVETFLNYASMLAQVFSDYETTDESIRRSTFNELLSSTIEQNKQIMGIFTAWKPNTIDSYDAQKGQYQAFYTRRRTSDVELVATGYENWQQYLAEMTTTPVLANPVWRDVVNRGNVPIVSAQYPVIDSNNRVVGMVGINYISSMQQVADDLAKEIYDGAGMTGVYTNDGTILAHFDRDRVGGNMKTSLAEIKELGDDADYVINSIKAGHLVTIDKQSSFLGEKVHYIYYPISFSEIGTPWSLMVVIPLSDINQPIMEMIFFAVLIGAIILIVAGVITYFVSHSMVKPIIGVTKTLKDISEGEGDLTRTSNINSKDEVGDLARYKNQTLEKIKSLEKKKKNETGKLSEIGNDLSSNMTETAAAVNEITANIQSIKGRIVNQGVSVSQTNSTMDHLMVNIRKLDGHVDNQSSNMAQASSSIEQMVANIRAVTDTLIRNEKNVQILMDASEVGRIGMQEVTDNIREISHKSEGLLEINAVMKNISSQTNLLSMNAAIEAAHAGEAGKGFAVVADEIRKLAQSSSEQSKKVGSVLKEIKDSIDKITISTESVLGKFEAIDSSVKTVAEQEESIRNAMEEQGTGSQQTLIGVSNVNEITVQVTSSSHEMLDEAKEVIEESSNLEKVTQEITSGMNEMAMGAEQINIAVHQVNEISTLNRDGIAALINEVSRFKVA
jgi:methyl-accepting chemotaxis protein